ncbi:hypothetical protein HA402_005408 [Bradysia odoriphaga]|nr:hypothetical protein HA402_005408 [Bradysia odoriphaga]
MCKMNFLSRHRNTFSIAYVTHHTIKILNYRSKMFYQYSNNEFRPFLIDMRVEMCSVNNRTSKSLLQSVFAGIVKNHTNMDAHCPLPPAEYYFKNVSVGAANLPSLLPEGRYKLRLTNMGEMDEILSSFYFFFQIKNYGILDLRMG